MVIMEYSLIQSQLLRTKYPDCRPIILVSDEKLLKTKILLNKEATVSNLMTYIRLNNKLNKFEAYYIFANNILVNHSDTIGSLYNLYRRDTGFLYLTIKKENTFG